MTLDEMKLAVAEKLVECGDINNAPFGLNHEESTAYLRGRSSALQWMAEVLLADIPPSR